MKRILLLALLSALSVANAKNNQQSFTTFMPENTMRISVDHPKRNSIMDEATFNKVIDTVSKYYQKDFKDRGWTFEVERDWDDPTVNAYAQARGNKRTVKMFGGLARHKDITPDGFAMVVCHEIGHHLGGAVKYSSTDWASAEGQSDYWGAFQCMKRYILGNGDIWGEVRRMQRVGIRFNPKVIQMCKDTYNHPIKEVVCVRTAMAGLGLSYLLNGSRTPKPSFDTPDPRVVSRTNKRHPAAQCRLDTYLAGALCDLSPFLANDDRDPNVGTCNRSENFEIGLRPLCWFKPEDERLHL